MERSDKVRERMGKLAKAGRKSIAEAQDQLANILTGAGEAKEQEEFTQGTLGAVLKERMDAAIRNPDDKEAAAQLEAVADVVDTVLKAVDKGTGNTMEPQAALSLHFDAALNLAMDLEKQSKGRQAVKPMTTAYEGTTDKKKLDSLMPPGQPTGMGIFKKKGPGNLS